MDKGCELLEQGRTMDSSVLVGAHFKDRCKDMFLDRCLFWCFNIIADTLTHHTTAKILCYGQQQCWQWNTDDLPAFDDLITHQSERAPWTAAYDDNDIQLHPCPPSKPPAPSSSPAAVVTWRHHMSRRSLSWRLYQVGWVSSFWFPAMPTHGFETSEFGCVRMSYMPVASGYYSIFQSV